MSDDFGEALRRFGKKVEDATKSQAVPFAELFNPAFMARYSSVPTMEALIDATGYDVNTPEDFAAIPDELWEQAVRANTSFGSWLEMQQKAATEWMAKKIRG